MEWTLGEIAEQIGAELHGDAGLAIRGVCDWRWIREKGLSGGEDLLGWEARPLTDGSFLDSAVQALIVPRLPDGGLREGKSYLVSQDPRYAFAEVAGRFHPLPRATETRIHETAVIDESAIIEEPVQIGARCVIGARSRIGRGCVLEAQVHVGVDCVIGEDSVLEPFVVVLEGTRVGRRNHLGTGAKIGVTGFGNVPRDGRFLRIPQVGIVITGDDVQIGAHTCVDRAALGETRIEEGVRVDNLVQIAHNCRVGAHSGIAALAGLAGSTDIGEQCMIGGQVGFRGHQTICARVALMGQSGPVSNITEPGIYFGTPARPVKETHRITVALARLPRLLRRVRALEARLEQDP